MDGGVLRNDEGAGEVRLIVTLGRGLDLERQPGSSMSMGSSQSEEESAKSEDAEDM